MTLREVLDRTTAFAPTPTLVGYRLAGGGVEVRLDGDLSVVVGSVDEARRLADETGSLLALR